MKKLVELLKNTVVLVVITVIAGGLLGFVYENTKGPIALKEEELKIEACQEAFTSAYSFVEDTEFNVENTETFLDENGFPDQTIDAVFQAVDVDGNSLGYVLKVITHEGYNGDISFMMGVSSDGTIQAMSILSIAETPGLGMRAEDEIVPQVTDKKVAYFEYTKTGAVAANQIDAMSGATITTNAITNGLNAGIVYFNTLGGGANE